VTSTPLRPPLAYFGSKIRVAPVIADLMPRHLGYVEPYCGSLAVLMAKRPEGFEVVNDLDQDLVHFWRVLRERTSDLERVCRLTPHARAEYDAGWPIPDGADELERARLVWLKLSQGRNGSLRRTGWRFHETPSGRTSTMPQTLRGYIDRFWDVAERLAAVTLECRPALDVIARYGRDADTLLYVDPPYFGGTRLGSSYRHEMTGEDEHRDLAAALHAVPAAVMLSGYPSPLYDDLYAGWHREEIKSGTGQNAAAGYQLRTEVVWCNRPLARQVGLWEDAR
jgi:DNA adenine methylase